MSEKNEPYIIVTADNVQNLEYDVLSAIVDGYKPVGGVAVLKGDEAPQMTCTWQGSSGTNNTLLMQAMVKKAGSEK